jgi:hypothetical protein
MDRSWLNTRLFSKEHRDGVTEFMNFVSDNLGDSQEILCPCRKCLNRLHKHKGEVEYHLYIYGMTNTYTRWIHHGEAFEVGLNENSETGDTGCSVETGDIGCMLRLLLKLFPKCCRSQIHFCAMSEFSSPLPRQPM